ncbi:hypothetical protein [Cupriavidus sp. 8B]
MIEDAGTRRRCALPYAAIIADTTVAAQQPPQATAPPPRAQRAERIGTIVRINQKTASVQCNPDEGHWRVSFALLRKVVDL